MGKIRQFYYQVKMNTTFEQYNFQEIPYIINKYGHFDDFKSFSEEELESGSCIDKDKLMVFKNGSEYQVFYKNLKLIISLKKEKEHVVRMYLKKEGDMWDLRVDGSGKSMATNQMEIYLDYDVVVLEDKHCWNTTYDSGAWDEYVYNTVNDMINEINSMTEYNQFNLSYNGTLKREKRISCCRQER